MAGFNISNHQQSTFLYSWNFWLSLKSAALIWAGFVSPTCCSSLPLCVVWDRIALPIQHQSVCVTHTCCLCACMHYMYISWSKVIWPWGSIKFDRRAYMDYQCSAVLYSGCLITIAEGIQIANIHMVLLSTGEYQTCSETLFICRPMWTGPISWSVI